VLYGFHQKLLKYKAAPGTLENVDVHEAGGVKSVVKGPQFKGLSINLLQNRIIILKWNIRSSVNLSHFLKHSPQIF
jgi:hypothetical protein